MSSRLTGLLVLRLALLVPAGMLACQSLPGAPGSAGRDEAVTLEEVIDSGDDQRRASNHLVDQGLEADQLADAGRALDRYELALQVDPGNPWAYLALARHQVDRNDPRRALASLDRCRTLLERRGEISPRVETHLLGLRGAALVALGSPAAARPLLTEARRRAPSVWDDGRLEAEELR